VDRALSGELRRVVAAARGWLEELREEGLEALPEPTEPRARTPKPSPLPASAAPVADARERQRALLDPPKPDAPTAWGDAPTLETVREVLGECTRCGLSQTRNRIVFGDGNPDADLMFIGEGPGAEEDRRGLPFVGRAGELLTSMIEKGMGISRSEVYICNIVKCRPPENRTPHPEEAATCRPFLDGQIAAVRPRVIVALGRPAASLLLGRDVSISKVRGIWHEYRGIPLMPTYHPAYVLRQYTPEVRRAVWSDLKAALARTREG